MSTPADISITPRDIRFNRGEAPARWWHGGDPVATAYFNALSTTFPQGETFFIDSVRQFRERSDGTLRQQIDAFIQQEAAHTREHVVFNRLIKSGGYDISAMDAYTRKRIDIARSRHPVAQLAVTVALEHFTAIMAHSLLVDRKPMPGAPEEILRMWQWHAIEEIEHKSVAFDTYQVATRNLSSLVRWMIRCQVMLLISLQFWRSILRHMADFFRQDGINSVRTWLRALNFLLLKPGVARKIFLPYLSFYLPGFHPWRHDDRHLIAQFEKRFSPNSP
jgi:predicted metal-dependent hydrolase